MKFGKQLQLAALPAWSDYYFHYKDAKQLLKRKLAAVKAAAAAASAAASGDADAATAAAEAAAAEAAQKAREVVAQCIKREIVAYDNFTKGKLLGVEEALAGIAGSNAAALKGGAFTRATNVAKIEEAMATPTNADAGGAAVGSEGARRLWPTKGTKAGSKAKAGDSPPAKLPTAKQEQEAQGGDGGAGAAAASATAAPDAAGGAQQTAAEAGDDEDDDSDDEEEEEGSPAQRRAQLEHLERRLNLLSLFVQLNATAVSKLAKKFDKHFVPLGATPPLRPVLGALADKRRAVRDAQTEELRTALAVVMEDYPQPPMVREGKLDDPDSSADFGVTDVINVNKIEIKKLPVAAITNLSLAMSTNGLGESIRVPVIVAKGAFAGPTVGITCAIHGNELNGIPIIHRVLRTLNVDEMCGVLVAVPVMNPPGFLRHQREFSDGQDLNRLFPGSATGNAGNQYAHLVLTKILSKLEYVLDLHTASFGRVNSLYVRADMSHPVVRQMALLQNPQIIVHNSSPGGSIRSVCATRGIPCVTVEIGNPSTFHPDFLKTAFLGVENVLAHLQVTSDQVAVSEFKPVICNSSAWSFATHGGILEVLPALCSWVLVGQVIARIRNVYGDVTHVYRAQNEGVVIGKNMDPVCQRGDRLLHLGFVTGGEFEANVQDGH